MCYNTLMKKGCVSVQGPEVAACCTESHTNITRLLDSPRLGRQLNLGNPGWQELFPSTKQSGVADSFKRASLPEEGAGT